MISAPADYREDALIIADELMRKFLKGKSLE
jgi:hypothetical protein